MGNEWNVINDNTLLQKVNMYMEFARNYSIQKWGRKIPLTHVLVDDPFEYDIMYSQLNVDIFSTNAGYRGLGFSDLWDGSQTPGFSGLGPLSIKYNIPNFVSEIGWMQLNGTQTAEPQNAGWFNIKWRDLIKKGTIAGCIGGAFFEYIDEVITKADPLEQTQGIVSPRVSSLANFPMTTGSTVTDPVLSHPYNFSGSAQSGGNRSIGKSNEVSIEVTTSMRSSSATLLSAQFLILAIVIIFLKNF